MVQPTGTFGRKIVAPSLAASPAPNGLNEPPAQNKTSNSRLKFFNWIFVWIPNGQEPGLPAAILVLLRQVLLPVLFFLPVFIFSAVVLSLLELANFNPTGLHLASSASVAPYVGALWYGSLALSQELTCYSFIRQATRPLRAILLFTAVSALPMLALHHDYLYTAILGMLAIQLVANAAIFLARGHRRYLPVVIIILLICQTGGQLTADQFGHGPAASDANNSIPRDTGIPTAGNMQVWAKLYPDAVLTLNHAKMLGGATKWTAIYTVKASPEQIEAFYAAVANSEGFTQSPPIFGLHIFKQGSTGNRFTYSVTTDPAGSKVDFEARASGN